MPISSLIRQEHKGIFPYYGAASILDYYDDWLFDGRYLLFAEDGSVITKDGKPVLQLTYDKFWVNNHAHVIQGKSPLSTEFLYYSLCEVSISGYITGAAQPKITQENLNRIPVIIPEIGILNRYNEYVIQVQNLVENLTKRNSNLRRQRDLLLPRLVSGELDVEKILQK